MKIFKYKLLYAVIFMVVVAVVVFYKLDYILAYQEQKSLFLFESNFFYDLLGQPFGVTLYIANFITQLFYYPILGATLVALIYGASFYMLSTINRNRDQLMLALLPVIFIFAKFNENSFIVISVMMMLNLLIYKLWVSSPRIALYTALPAIALAYFATGMAASIATVMIVVRLLSEYRLRPVKLLFVVLICACAALLPALGAILYDLPYKIAYILAIDQFDQAYFTVTLLFLSMALYAELLPGVSMFRRHAWIGALSFVALMAAGWWWFNYSYNEQVRRIMLIEQAAEREEWDRVLDYAASESAPNIMKTYLTNVALFRTGQFVDNLFNYTQQFGEAGLAIPWNDGRSTMIKIGDLFYANIGMVNEACRLAFETCEQQGRSQLRIRKLSHYNRLWGRESVAQKYDRILDQTLFYAHDNHKINYCPGSMVVGDSLRLTDGSNCGENLIRIVESDSTNMAAFDYLAAFYLLTNQLSRFAELMPRAIVRYQGRLPRNYDEALVILRSLNAERFAELGYEIPKEIETKFINFNKTVWSGSGSNARANAENSYGTTYWFYLTFVSPYGQNVN